MNMKKFLQVFGVLLMISISLLLYNSLHGNPIGYIRAKHNIRDYIETNYNNELKIKNIFYSGKAGGYIAEVEDIDDTRNKSNINYYNTGYIGDDYYFRTWEAMGKEVENTILNLIIQQDIIQKESIRIYADIKLPKFEYSVGDSYSGEEDINLEIELYKTKENLNNEDEFKKRASEILDLLKIINYNYKSVTIYSYREDGNSRYEMHLDGKALINTIEKEKAIN